MEKLLKRTVLTNLISSILFIFVGIVLFYYPTTMLSLMSYIVEVILIVIGIITLTNYIFVETKYNMFSYGFVYGVVCIILALFLITNPNTLVTVLSTILGIWMIFGSFNKIQFGLKLNSMGKNIGILNITLALLMFCCGLLIVCNPFEVARIIIQSLGIIVVIYSVIDIIQSITLIKNIKVLIDD